MDRGKARSQQAEAFSHPERTKLSQRRTKDDIALILQLVAQFLQTTQALSPSPTTTSLSQIASAIVSAQDSNPIKWLQGAVNATVGSNLAIDGQFGPRTEAAIEQLLERLLNPQESDTVLSAVKILLSKVR